MAAKESHQDPQSEQEAPPKEKEVEEKPVKAKKVELLQQAAPSDRASFPDSPKKGSESRRSFKKDKEVDNLRKRVGELDNERRQLDKSHAKRLKERENELLIQHSEERDRITQQHKEERDRFKREQKEEMTALKKKAVQEARGELTKEIKGQLKEKFEKDYEDKLKKEVEALKQKESANAEKKKEFGSDKKKGRGGRETSTTPRGQTTIAFGKANEEELTKLKTEKEQAQKNYMSCLQNYEAEKKQTEQLKKSLADLEKTKGVGKADDAKKGAGKQLEKEKREIEAKHQKQIDTLKKDLMSKFEEQANEMTEQIEKFKKSNDEGKKTYEILKKSNLNEIEKLKKVHQNELAKLKQSQGKQTDSSKNDSKPSGVDKMKQMLAKEFEQRIKKQEDVIKEMDEIHNRKVQQMKVNSEKEKVEILQKYAKEADQQKSATR